MKEISFNLMQTETKNNEQLFRQDLLMDCENGDRLFIDSSHFCEDHSLSVLTAWGEDIGVLPVEVSQEVLELLESGQNISLHITSISGDYGHLSCKVSLTPTFH